jgi:NDP-sugar pyrophosphorylase family protein
MVKFHNEHQALATLAVQDRKTSRYLLFDDASQLCGRKSGKDGTTELVRPSEHLHPLAFNGIHIISPRLLNLMTEDGAFSIIATYMRLAGKGEKILGFSTDEYHWRDLGTAEGVAQAAQDLRTGRISLDT